MDIRCGKIKNISKKIVAGALTFTLVTLPLIGCDSISIDSIKYTQSNGEVAKKNISIDSLEHCSFYEVYNPQTNERYYTIVFQDVWNEGYLIKYYDFFTEEKLLPGNFSIKFIDTVKNYLSEENLVKNEYTEEELSEILNRFILNYGESKILIKE